MGVGGIRVAIRLVCEDEVGGTAWTEAVGRVEVAREQRECAVHDLAVVFCVRAQALGDHLAASWCVADDVDEVERVLGFGAVAEANDLRMTNAAGPQTGTLRRARSPLSVCPSKWT